MTGIIEGFIGTRSLYDTIICMNEYLYLMSTLILFTVMVALLTSKCNVKNNEGVEIDSVG